MAARLVTLLLGLLAAPGAAWAAVQLEPVLAGLANPLYVASFGEDEAGELYVVGLGGTVHRLVNR